MPVIEEPPGSSPPEVLEPSEKLISNLQTLREQVSGELAEKQEELRELHRNGARLEQFEKQLDDLRGAQRQWAAEREELINERDRFRRAYEELRRVQLSVSLPLAGREREGVPVAPPAEPASVSLPLAGREREGVWQSERQRLVAELGRLAQQVRDHEQDRRRLEARLRETLHEKQELEGRQAEFGDDQARLQEQLAALADELDGLRSGRAQMAVDRGALLQERDAAVERLAQLEQQWQRDRARLTEEKTNLETQVADLRQQLAANMSRLEQEVHHLEPVLKADSEKTHNQLGEMETERHRLIEERRALVTEITALERDLETREAAYQAERAKLQEEMARQRAELDTLRSGQVAGPIDREETQTDSP